MSINRAYVGERAAGGSVRVRVADEDEVTLLDPRFDLRNHSPTGFEWGYGGSGPAQLALAILADACGDDERAQRLYQRFKSDHIAAIPQEAEAFRITRRYVLEWMDKCQKRPKR